ncbi:hypothetical protein V8C86DRAFT_58994 [Haematococcus lacustris]
MTLHFQHGAGKCTGVQQHAAHPRPASRPPLSRCRCSPPSLDNTASAPDSTATASQPCVQTSNDTRTSHSLDDVGSLTTGNHDAVGTGCGKHAVEESSSDHRQQSQQTASDTLSLVTEGHASSRAKVAALVAWLAAGTACYATLASQPSLPPLPPWLVPAVGCSLAGAGLGLLVAKVVLGDKFHMELHG